MSHELFLEIVNRQLFAPLFFICVAYLLCWVTTLALGLVTLNVKNVSLRKLFSLAVVGSLYSFWIRQIIPTQLTGILLPIVSAILLWIAVRGFHPLKYSLASIIVMLTSFAGDIFILAPICSINSHLSFFLLRTAWGNVLSTGAETFFPFLVLLILPKAMPKFKSPLTLPIGLKLDNLDHYTFMVYAGMYMTVYTASIVMYVSLISGSKFIFLSLIFLWITMGSFIWAHFRIVKRDEILKSKLEADKAKLESDKSRLESEKQQLEIARNQLTQEKSNLENEKIQLEEIKNILKNENTNLINQIGKLSDSATNGENKTDQQLQALLNDQVINVNNIISTLNRLESNNNLLMSEIKSNKFSDNASPTRSDNPAEGQESALYLITGKSNAELATDLDLTDLDVKLIELIIAGYIHKEIARIVHRSDGHIRNLVSAILGKLNVKDKNELIKFIIKRYKKSS